MVLAIKDICIFIIIAQAVLCFAPGNSYEKYIRILVGIIMILRITEPVFGIFLDGEAKKEIQSRVTVFMEELDEIGQEIEIDDRNAEVYSSIKEEVEKNLTGVNDG